MLPPLPLLATLLEVRLPKVLSYNLSLGEDDNTDVLTTYDGHFVNVTLTAGTLSSGINAFALNFGDGETVTGIVKIDNGNLKDGSISPQYSRYCKIICIFAQQSDK